MNIYFIIGLALAVTIACAGSAYEGHSIGVNSQKAADQLQFDAINQKTADQKTTANAQYRALQDANLKLAGERDILKTTLETQHVANQKVTTGLRTQLASTRLQFAAAQTAGPGN